MNKRIMQQGMKAFKDGKLANPYKENTEKYRDWEFGFNTAYFQNLTEVQARERSERVS